MTRIERLKEKLAEYRREQMNLYRAGRYDKGQRLNAKIEAVQQAIADAEAYEPRKLSEMIDRKTLDESGLCELIVETHMAADYFYDTVFGLKSLLNKLGFQDCSLFRLADQIQKLSCEYASIVCHPEFAGLQDFILTDEELIDNLHKVSEAYLKEHLNITKGDEVAEDANK